MGYYIAIAAGVVVGFFLCAALASAGREERRCINCHHHRQLPENVPGWLGDGHIACVAFRGNDYEIPGTLQSISLVKPDGFCSDFCPRGDDDDA